MTTPSAALSACAEHLLDPSFAYDFLPHDALRERIVKDKRLTGPLREALLLAINPVRRATREDYEALEIPEDLKTALTYLGTSLKHSAYAQVRFAEWAAKTKETGSAELDDALAKFGDVLLSLTRRTPGSDAELELFRAQKAGFEADPRFYLAVLQSLINKPSVQMTRIREVVAGLMPELRDPTDALWAKLRKTDAVTADALAATLFLIEVGDEPRCALGMPVAARCFWSLGHPEKEPLLRAGGRAYEAFAQAVLWAGCVAVENEMERFGAYYGGFAEDCGLPKTLVTDDFRKFAAGAAEETPDALGKFEKLVKLKADPKKGRPEDFMAVLGTCLQARRDSLISFGVDLTGSEKEIAKREKDIDAAKVLWAERAEAFKAERRKTSYKKTPPTELFRRMAEAFSVVSMNERWSKKPADSDRASLMRLMEAFTATEDAESSLGDRHFVAALRRLTLGLYVAVCSAPLGWPVNDLTKADGKLAPLNKLFADAGFPTWNLRSVMGRIHAPEAPETPEAAVAPAPLPASTEATDADGTELVDPGHSTLDAANESAPVTVTPQGYVNLLMNYYERVAARPTCVAKDREGWTETKINRMKAALGRFAAKYAVVDWEAASKLLTTTEGSCHPDFQPLMHLYPWLNPDTVIILQELLNGKTGAVTMDDYRAVQALLVLHNHGNALWRRNFDWFAPMYHPFGAIVNVRDDGELGVAVLEKDGNRAMVTVGLADEVTRISRAQKRPMPEYAEEWIVLLPESVAKLGDQDPKLVLLMTNLLAKAKAFVTALEAYPTEEQALLPGSPFEIPVFAHLRKLRNERKVKKPGKKGAVKVLPGEFDSPSIRLRAIPFEDA